MAPIQITPGPAGRLTIVLPYSAERLSKIKTVPGRRWNSEQKTWTVPQNADTAQNLRTLFANDEIEWAPELRPAPLRPSRASEPIIRSVHEAIRARHMSPRTEETYSGWIRRFLEAQPPQSDEPAEAAIGRFLSTLATEGHVSASTQNQALHALIFFHEEVLGKKLARVEDIVRAKRSERLPVVLSRDEVRAVIDGMSGTPRLMAMFLYGSGLRVLECCSLRVKDIDFSLNQLGASNVRVIRRRLPHRERLEGLARARAS